MRNIKLNSIYPLGKQVVFPPTTTERILFMKKRIISTVIMIAVVIAGAAFAAHSSVDAEDIEDLNQGKAAEYISQITTERTELSLSEQEMGEIEDIVKSADSDEIYEIGKDFVISEAEVEQYEEFYQMNGSEDAREEATAFAEERAALYAEALKNGYDVTDDEIRTYLGELKRTLKETMSEEDYNNLVNAAGSEEEYWKYEYYVYKVDLPIQRYVSDKEAKFKDNSNTTDDTQLEQEWADEFENLKNELVDKQDFN